MANNTDFRQYSYSSDASYAVQAFNMSRSSAAPAYAPRRQRELKVRENSKRKSRTELLREQRLAFGKVIAIGTVALLAIAMLFGMLHTNAKKNELNHEISTLETQLSIAQSENTRINSELNSLVSMSMIDQYAVEKLGMSKVRSNQIRYIDVSRYKEERKAAALLQLEQGQ